jgi:hypothetical protein
MKNLKCQSTLEAYKNNLGLQYTISNKHFRRIYIFKLVTVYFFQLQGGLKTRLIIQLLLYLFYT